MKHLGEFNGNQDIRLSGKINEIIDWINQKEKLKPTICVYGCGRFKDLMKHYKEKHSITF